jgi:hypothetical protein
MVVHFSILDFLLLYYDYLYYNIVILSKLVGKLIQFQKTFHSTKNMKFNLKLNILNQFNIEAS